MSNKHDHKAKGMRFITYKEIEEHCVKSDCTQWERRTSVKGINVYYYCLALQEPCFVCLDKCIAQMSDKIRDEKGRLDYYCKG